MAEISVVVPARNAEATIGRTLAALAVQARELDYEVIVVDSGSVDTTPELVWASGSARLVRNPGGEPASSRNLGARIGTGKVLAFTDSDCEPAPEWLAAGTRALADADIVQGRVLPAKRPGPFDRTVTVEREYGLYETANLFVRRETFEHVGGFRQLLVLAPEESPFAEDAWFVWRARRAGARTAFCTAAVVRHAVFERGPRAYVAEQARRRLFPPLVAAVPELRRVFLRHRVFLSADSERFDLALAAVIISAFARRRVPWLIAVAPYVSRLAAQSRGLPARHRLSVLSARIAADAVTLAALVQGSIAARSLVL